MQILNRRARESGRRKSTDARQVQAALSGALGENNLIVRRLVRAVGGMSSLLLTSQWLERAVGVRPSQCRWARKSDRQKECVYVKAPEGAIGRAGGQTE